MATSVHDYLPAETYGDAFVANQVRKYRERDRNHWKLRMRTVFDRLGPLPPGARVLDLACGVGTFTIESARRGYDVVGVDYSPHVLRAGKALAEEERVACRFVLGDATRLSFGDASFDAIIAADIVEHLFDEPLLRMFQECARVLKPGGRLLIHTTPTRYHYMFSPLRAAALVPFAWLPQAALDRAIELYERYPFSLAYKLRFGETWVNLTARRGHCNCPSYYRLGSMLEQSGFRLAAYEAVNGPEDLATRSQRVVAAIFKRSKHAKAHIWAVCVKP